MLLTIDIGNTTTAFGLWPDGDDPETEHPLSRWRLSSARERTADEWRSLVEPHLAAALAPGEQVRGVVVSSVVPAITDAINRLVESWLGVPPLLITPDLDLGIQVRTDAPRETGADRIVNCAAAYARFGGPTIVVDTGTATKIEAITADGAFIGGVIAPGVAISLDALATRAARLYAVELRLPAHAVGRNTVTALQSGVVAGHLAMIEGMVRRVSEEIGGAKAVVLTGGNAEIFAGASACFTAYEPDLTLRGLRLVWHRNRDRATAPGP
ncbi:MAG TPA: type III pantothenate kinase [Thermomicrobiales bacterium]